MVISKYVEASRLNTDLLSFHKDQDFVYPNEQHQDNLKMALMHYNGFKGKLWYDVNDRHIIQNIA